MRVTEIDHVNIRTKDVAASARFYADLFALEARDAPGYPAEIAQWMYNDQNRPFMKRLAALGRAFQTREVPEESATAICTRDPHGVMLEVYFND